MPVLADLWDPWDEGPNGNEMTKYVYDETRRAIVKLEPQVPGPLAEDICVLAAADGVDGGESRR